MDKSNSRREVKKERNKMMVEDGCKQPQQYIQKKVERDIHIKGKSR